MRLLTSRETAERLGVAERSVSDKRWRLRAGLQAVRIGKRRIGFIETDIDNLIRRGIQPLPGERR